MVEVDPVSIGAAFAVVPAMGIVGVLERRGAAVNRFHASAGPGARDAVDLGPVVAVLVRSGPGAEHVADLVDHRAEELGLPGLLEILAVEGHGPGVRLPVRARPQASGTGHTARVAELRLGHVDGQPGAGLAPRAHPDLAPVGAVVPDQAAPGLARQPFPLLPRVVDAPAPHLAGALQRRPERCVLPQLSRGVFEVEPDGERVGGAAGPASVGHLAALAEHRDRIAVPKARHGRPAAHPARGPEQVLEPGRIAAGVLDLREQPRQDRGGAVAPVIEKVVCMHVVDGAQRHVPPPAWRGVRRHRVAARQQVGRRVGGRAARAGRMRAGIRQPRGAVCH